MTRFLAWCAGASIGYVVGWLAGSNVQRMAEGRHLAADYRRNEGAPMSAERRARLMAYTPRQGGWTPPEPRSGVPAPRETPEGLNGPEKPLRWVDLFGIDPDYTDGLPVDVWLDRNRRDADPIPAQRDDEPCTERSPGGGLVCCRKGTHVGHLFEGAHARDRKDDTDEGIE